MANQKLGAVNDVGLAGAKRATGGSVGKGSNRGAVIHGGKIAAAPHTHSSVLGRDKQRGTPKMSKRGISNYHSTRGKMAIPGALAGPTGITYRGGTARRPQTR